MKAFLEKIGGEYLDDFVYISKQPLIRLGFEVIEFDSDDLENTLFCYPINIDEDVLIGCVETTVKFLNHCDVETPKYLGYPDELHKYLGREISYGVMSEVNKENFPIFIKPRDSVKLFTGEVIESKESLDFLYKFNPLLTPDTKIIKSEVINIISEYRCFIHEEKITGIKHYQGDFKIFPSVSVIENMVKDYTKCNSAYTLDVGITSTGETILIEVNDMWAIGSYGLNGKDYTLACVRRFRGIVRQSKGEITPLYKKLKRDRF